MLGAVEARPSAVIRPKKTNLVQEKITEEIIKNVLKTQFQKVMYTKAIKLKLSVGAQEN